MRILVTGAQGFIGRNLVPELIGAGHMVTGVDIADGDLTQKGVIERLIVAATPEVVIHLAGLVGRLFGETDPEATIRANTLSTLYVAQACSAVNVRLAYASTSEAFGDHGDKLVSEDVHGVLPYNLYGLSKRWAEEVATLYKSTGLQIFRLSMPYGPGLPAGRGRAALVTFLWQAIHREPLTVHRGGRRCWCWIGDSVRGIRMVVEDSGLGVWTIGRDDNEMSMLDVANVACTLAGAPHNLITLVNPPDNQTVVKRLETKRLRDIGWQPEVGLMEGMRRTYEAVKTYDEHGRPQQ